MKTNWTNQYRNGLNPPTEGTKNKLKLTIHGLNPSVVGLFFALIFSTLQCKPPRLTVAIVVDQFAYHYINKVKPHLTSGLKDFFEKGIFYKNAYVPHCHPSTSTGHVTISTGTYPKTHGIIGNRWLSNNKAIKYENLNVNPEHIVFYSEKSPLTISGKNILVDTISDQFVLNEQPKKRRQVFAISHKPRASVGLSGQLGKAIWFDGKTRRFTSSKAYFDNLPDWLDSFNKQYLPSKIPEALTWKLFHGDYHKAYNFFHVNDYKFAAHPFSLINNPFETIKHIPNSDARKTLHNGDYSELYIKTPHANQHLLDLARLCLDKNFDYKNKNSRFLLWLSLSPLDPLGHYYGPDSKETIDMIYHLDWQLKQFMKELHKKINPKEVLYVFTADHGVMPIIKLLQQKGLTNARRINEKKLIKNLNDHINQKHNVPNLIMCYANSSFYVNKNSFMKLSKQKKLEITNTIKSFLKKQPGILEIWTGNELKNLKAKKEDINQYFKNQYYEGRSGEFICKCAPYCTITKHALGTNHRTPYEYDTHVPLVIYQKGIFRNKTIEKNVEITQLANTLAKILNVAKPSASRAKVLPGI